MSASLKRQPDVEFDALFQAFRDAGNADLASRREQLHCAIDRVARYLIGREMGVWLDRNRTPATPSEVAAWEILSGSFLKAAAWADEVRQGRKALREGGSPFRYVLVLVRNEMKQHWRTGKTKLLDMCEDGEDDSIEVARGPDPDTISPMIAREVSRLFWAELPNLDLNRRTALILRLDRDELDGFRRAVPTGITEIAALIAVPPSRLAGWLNHLPLAEMQIARHLGLPYDEDPDPKRREANRKKVNNLAPSARRTLVRALARQRPDLFALFRSR